ncbi:MAG TPA: class I SAM-dependent methyltransferase [Mycobacteriales bacterium]|nr:class I SAM-dependent methyltransferase [Mycobacteriales bacterium]
MSEADDFGRRFGTVADQYDEARPSYPDEVFDALDDVIGGLAGCLIVDLAAGTGLQTRTLVARGAHVIAVDADHAMLMRLRSRSPDVPAVVGRSERLPLRDGVADVVTCATAWQWLPTDETTAEVARVLRPGGHLALWWAVSPFGDGIEWEDAQSAVIERWDQEYGARPDPPGSRPSDAVDDLRARGVDVVFVREFAWTRSVTRAEHLRTIATYSPQLARPEDERRALLAEIDAALAPWPVVDQRWWGPLVVARF